MSCLRRRPRCPCVSKPWFSHLVVPCPKNLLLVVVLGSALLEPDWGLRPVTGFFPPLSYLFSTLLLVPPPPPPFIPSFIHPSFFYLPSLSISSPCALQRISLPPFRFLHAILGRLLKLCRRYYYDCYHYYCFSSFGVSSFLFDCW
ncbi:hypothetical protein BO82DRAFT_57046 [Aspergillus uvarum CBS 121591]|uniref:Uncharacterized protein n=1 Tax=Aspergillus uvarum CBS 121591 TaxID=1448315 RepID=A0A319CHQ4_9EURO|nr:hypothetical protein BO82DRAFT_57046 [Aspergillus uvarum CBS 121591]PYH82797.1 hypothetical protein BO82DRAFT_57046 [Aspergillus uvarum CBS 121591]